MSGARRPDLVFVFVDLKAGPQAAGDNAWTPDVFIVPSKEIRRARAFDSAAGWFCLKDDQAQRYMNRWDIIENVLS